MLDDNLIIYQHLDLELPTIPTRSRFYQLEPIGLGTSHVESLTSYITRLAQAHCVYTQTLFSKELIFATNKPRVCSSSRQNGLSNIQARVGALNSIGIMAMDWVQAVESLTFRKDLRFLTLLPWAEVFPSLGLLRPYKAWCPYCYKEWHESSREVYDPLIWTLADVQICLHHGCFLHTRCPCCQKESPWIDWKSKLGYCSKCNRWLGMVLESQPLKAKIMGKDELSWEMWVANNVENLIASAPNIQRFPNKDKIMREISICINRVTEGNAAAFSRMLPRPKNTVCLWQAGKTLPPLKGLLQICYASEITLKDFLLEDKVAVTNATKAGVANPDKTCSPPRGTPRVLDLNSIQNDLEKFLLQHQLPPLKFKQVVDKLEYDTRTLRRHFPDLCCAISRKYARYQQIRGTQKVEKMCKEVQQVALQLYADGVYPTQTKVEASLSKPGFMRNKEARVKLCELQRKLKGLPK